MKPRKRFSQLYHSRNQLKITTYRGSPGYENVGTGIVGPAVDRCRSYKQIDDFVDTPPVGLGDIVINPVSLYSFETGKCEISLTAGPYPSWYNGGKEVFAGDIADYLTAVDPGWASFGTADLSAIRDIVLINAYAKIKDDSLLAGEMAATIGQTVKMLRKPLSGLAPLVKKLVTSTHKRCKPNPTIKQWNQAMANAYLEQRYGWKPLVMDTMTVFKAAKSNFSKFASGVRVSRAGQKFEFVKNSTFDIPIYGSVRADGTSSVKTKLKVDAGVFYYRLPTTIEERAMEFLSINRTDMLSTAWELTPFSFCVDWVTNIGAWLNAVSLPPSVVIEGSWVTTTEKRSNTLNGYCRASWSGVTNVTPFPPYERSNSRYDRLANPVLAKRPTMTGFPSMSQAAAGLALGVSGSLKSLLRI